MAKNTLKPKRLTICMVCGGYMRPQNKFRGEGVVDGHWRGDSMHRSFGGKELVTFECEACHHTETIQVDDFANIREDE